MSEEELLALLRQGEGPLHERKPTEDADEIRKTVVAFANTVRAPNVGILFLGVNEDGTPSGRIINPDKTQRKVLDYLQDCYPSIDGVGVFPFALEGQVVVAVTVPESRNTPHFTGPAYVRVGSSSRQASREMFEALVADRIEPARILRPWVGQAIHAQREYEPILGRRAWPSGHGFFRLELVDAVGLVLVPVGGGDPVVADWRRVRIQPVQGGHPPLVRISLD